MGDAGAEPSMEDILSSIKRIIAEEGDPAPRARRMSMRAVPSESDTPEEVLELSHPMETRDAAPVEQPVAAAPPPTASPAAAEPQTVVSPQTTEAARGALDALSRLLVKPDTAADGTLEGLVREMLRPMLSEWLDAKLPGIVESMVAREIARITGAAH